jgi:pentatricopeptide repeat protein
MMQKKEKGDRFTYLHVIQTLAMTHSPHYAALAHKLMRDDRTIEFRDVRMWASVINAYTNASMPEEAQQVLNEMEQSTEHQRQKQEQQHHVSKGMEDEDLLDHDGGTPVPWANTVCYNTVLDAWAKSGTPDAASNAEELLQRMDALYRSGTNPHVRPDVISFSSVILAWARSNHPLAAERADALLRRLEESEDPSIRPDRICYNTVIQAHLESTAMRRKDRFSAPDKQVSSVGSVSIQAVESILKRMKSVAAATGDYSIAPCTITVRVSMGTIIL